MATTATISPEMLQRIVWAVSSARNGNYLVLTSATLLFYDYFLTLSDEIKYIWSADWSAGKILFLINRYTCPIYMLLQLQQFLNKGLSGKACGRIFQISVWLSFVVLLTTELVLVLRTYALWMRNFRIWVFLWVVYAACSLATFGLLFRISSTVTCSRSSSSKPIMRACYYEMDFLALFGFWVPSLAFQVVVFSLNMWNFWFEHLRGTTSLPPLARILYRDGFIYIFIVFIFTLANHIIFLVGPPEYKQIMTSTLEVVTSICCTRMFLSLHGSILKTSENWQETNVAELSTFQAHQRNVESYPTEGEIQSGAKGDPAELPNQLV